ncbi:MAG: hypothetical protein KC591_00135 [Gemmatimonadetes bacterium]|nr:hypothetical protein [Gemmatimonadota bacterium]
MVVPALFLVILYSWIWLRFRPTRFVIHPDRLEVHWPLKRRAVPRQQVAEVRVLGRRALLDSTGWTVRIGAGGLWGGFGWLWTRRKGIVEMYISRTDEFVWMERPEGRPLLITPEEPAAFVQAWSGTTR